MHDSGAALAEPDDAPLSRIRLGGSSSAGAHLPELLDPRTVRVELTRLRTARGPRTVELARARIARSQGTSGGGNLR